MTPTQPTERRGRPVKTRPDTLTISALARQYGVNRRTMKRWIVELSKSVQNNTCSDKRSVQK